MFKLIIAMLMFVNLVFYLHELNKIRQTECLNGNQSKCLDNEWCQLYEGGRWIPGGFGAGYCAK